MTEDCPSDCCFQCFSEPFQSYGSQYSAFSRLHLPMKMDFVPSTNLIVSIFTTPKVPRFREDGAQGNHTTSRCPFRFLHAIFAPGSPIRYSHSLFESRHADRSIIEVRRIFQAAQGNAVSAENVLQHAVKPFTARSITLLRDYPSGHYTEHSSGILSHYPSAPFSWKKYRCATCRISVTHGSSLS